jgi:hypothetical protein
LGSIKCGELSSGYTTGGPLSIAQLNIVGWFGWPVGQYSAALIYRAVTNNFDAKKLAYCVSSCRHKYEIMKKVFDICKVFLEIPFLT